jgi:exopolysaccharide production protein ExoQ
MPRFATSTSTLTAGHVARALPTVTLSAAAFLAPLLAIYAPLGMAPLLAVTGAILALGLIAERRRPQFHQPAAVWIVAALLLWGAASLAWTLNPKGALLTLAQLSGVWLCALIAFAAATATDSRPIVRAMLVGILVALVIYAVERMFGAPIQGLFRDRGTEAEFLYSSFNRGLAVLVVLVPAAIIAIRRSYPWLCVMLAGATIALTFNFFGAAMTLAAVVALVVFTAALSGPWLIRSLGVLALIGILAAPFAVSTLVSPHLVDSVSRRSETVSTQHRLVIWRFTAGKILEKPLLGWGLDSARVMPGGKDTARLHTQFCEEPCVIAGEQLPLHPHNIALQLWLELGMVGAALGGAMIFAIFQGIAAAPVSRVDRALLAAQASAGLVIAGLSYGVWQSWWLSVMVLAGVLSTCVVRRQAEQAAPGAAS